MSERNGLPESVHQKIDGLQKIIPIDCKNFERWYPIQEETSGRSQVVMCRGVNMIHSQLSKGEKLMEWIKTNGQFADVIRDRRAAEGRTVHKGVELLHAGGTVRRKDHADNVYKAYVSYRNFVEKENPELLAIEKTCHSTRLRLAGTFDQLNYHDGILSVDDVKFTKYVYDEQFRTTETYAWLLKEMGIPVDRVGIIHLGAQTKQGYSYRTNQLDPRFREEFIPALLELWDYLHDDRLEPVLESLPDSISLPPRSPAGQAPANAQSPHRQPSLNGRSHSSR